MTIFFVIACVTGTVMIVAIRMARWHEQEADYWHHVSLLVLWDPEQDKTYRPLLDWVQENKPSVWAKLRGWRPPPERRARS